MQNEKERTCSIGSFVFLWWRVGTNRLSIALEREGKALRVALKKFIWAMDGGLSDTTTLILVSAGGSKDRNLLNLKRRRLAAIADMRL